MTDGSLPSWLWRGYTGHVSDSVKDLKGTSLEEQSRPSGKHLEELGLIDMNGPCYDPLIARMLSPDNYVQDPSNSQNFNRYSYVMNNPLKYVDPTGEKADHFYYDETGELIKRVAYEGADRAYDAKLLPNGTMQVDGENFEKSKELQAAQMEDIIGGEDQSGGSYGGSDIAREIVIGVTGAGLAEWGAANVPKPGGLGGGGKAGPWTSNASKTLRATKWGAKKLPFRVLGTKALGAVAGRLVPYVGWGLLAYDIVDFSVNFPWGEAYQILEQNQQTLDKMYGPGVVPIMPRGPK